MGVLFQSTPSTRRETSALSNQNLVPRYFNPLPPHGGRRLHRRHSCDMITISIHSLHTEGDLVIIPFNARFTISIHSLHTEGDRAWKTDLQSIGISIHSLHTEGDGVMAGVLVVDFLISIHSLHTEGDLTPKQVISSNSISIHSLHTEGDLRRRG